MDVELVTDEMPEDEGYDFDENFEEFSTFESERCGICMDVVIDRGVLDCCQHWFCFTCIDNWATITNLCPLCQIEFQLITCVPVFDTIGGNTSDDDSRDDDWSIEGKNNTLSFPSYYIDENAVVCLDGDGCKVRTGSAGNEDDSNLDTSIACDSCDIWYHAFCVGFDPEGSCDSSWLCPRCVSDNVLGKLDVSNSINQCDPENTSSNPSTEALFSGKVCVAVADDGETAVVVSMVEGDHEGGASVGQMLTSHSSENIETETPSSNSVVDIPNSVSTVRDCIMPNLKPEDQELPSSHEYSDFTSSSAVSANAETNISDQDASTLILLNRSAEHINNAIIDPGLTVGSCTEGLPGNESDDRVTTGKKEVPVAAGSKRKHKESRDAEKGRINKGKSENPYHLKKVKTLSDGQIDLKHQPVIAALDDASRSRATVLKDSKTRCSSKKESTNINIMDIVQGSNHKSLKKFARGHPDSMSSCKQRENAAGLRVKKIMRRVDGEDSSVVVQKLSNDIRDAVRSKSTVEFDKKGFEPKLLAAFRAVVAGPTTETMKSHVNLKAKQSLFQKGKVRENLTKKIYGVGGRRQRAWTRNCEIEFWKHRCSKASKLEKIQTLKSVLHRLKDDSENAEVKHATGEATGSILSRLYLADASVLPRSENIKPLNAMGKSEHRIENGRPATALTQSLLSRTNTVPQINEASKMDPISVGAKVAPKMPPSAIKKPDSSSREHLSKCREGLANTSSVPSNGEFVTPENTKSDKRKWALELLARKASAVSKNSAGGNAEDNVILKQNYPLLAQLPKDMLPALATSRHNKVPMSIRQAQLYRLTEHLLRKENLAVICRTAVTELAVADAINIEKEVADKSNSKLVYVNLCSQELLRRSDNSTSDKADQCTEVPSKNRSESSIENQEYADAAVNEALANAGLLSDSPPGTPRRPIEQFKDETCFSDEVEEDGPSDVLDVDVPPPDLDIYGDFEYNLDDDFTVAGNSSVIIPEPHLDEEANKIKVVFSTVNPADTSVITLEQPNMEGKVTVEAPKVSSCSVENVLSSNHASVDTDDGDHCADLQSSLVKVPEDSSCLVENIVSSSCASLDTDNRDKCADPQNSLVVERGEELSTVECEELYGPDKEPLIKKFPEMASMKPCELVINNHVSQTNGVCQSSSAPNSSNKHESKSDTDNVESASSQCPISEKSPLKKILDGSENVQRRDLLSKSNSRKESVRTIPVSRKVEAYIKEHIRPLCKSGVISVEQYRWAVSKTTEKVMKYHSKDKNANFLIKEGEKVKKLAEQYVEAAQNMPMKE
ncbi:unnamed protein product [Cuscuta epithymum]|uniref:RING-type domain-containing protein n=1 Tax=Cuscuta epithymum TaxID=186058 RepID=A0AAV0EL29_9ASTE|nr:unnamed protein product [Cuscuta epithymum]